MEFILTLWRLWMLASFVTGWPIHQRLHQIFSLRRTSYTRAFMSGAASPQNPRADGVADEDAWAPPQHVVVAGAGMMGVATAYYLAVEHGIPRITLVDPTGTVAPAASGKAGGFLALDWNDHAPTGPLTRRSFALHQQLADTLGADTIQYRRLSCASIHVDPYHTYRRPSGRKLEGIEWAQTPPVPLPSTPASTTLNPDKAEGTTLLRGTLAVRPLGDTDTIAQVHPKLLCLRMWEETCRRAQCELRQGLVLQAIHQPHPLDHHDDHEGRRQRRRLVGVQLQDGQILDDVDALMFACGPWTAQVMHGVKYHAVILPTSRTLQQCVFFSGCGDPEVYVRPDSTAYCTGYPDPATVVTEYPGQEAVSPDKIQLLLEAVGDATGRNGVLGTEPVAQQACYLPTTNDGLPIMGPLPPDVAGGDQCYICTGHTCWGILMGPASGEAMAHWIATGRPSDRVDLSAFAPSRYPHLDLVTLKTSPLPTSSSFSNMTSEI